ncbi:MAG: DUF177 domain-containing protein [Oscillospiraceae bacterium]|nr:DUF177 domain-containing protein [Oscillospiraceae bacterium]
MQINIKQLRDRDISVLPFEFVTDISDIEPTVASPVKVSGEIRNQADVIILSMTIEAERNLVCDRCAKEFSRVTSVPFEACVVDHLDNEDDEDDFIICETDLLEIGELAVSMFILGFDSKNLCSEDCKGLCQICGANLNEQTCDCKEESIDPRLQILSQLLDD